MGKNSSSRSRDRYRQRDWYSMHDHCQRRNREGRSVLSTDNKESHSCSANRIRVLTPHHLPRRFRGRVPADAG